MPWYKFAGHAALMDRVEVLRAWERKGRPACDHDDLAKRGLWPAFVGHARQCALLSISPGSRRRSRSSASTIRWPLRAYLTRSDEGNLRDEGCRDEGVVE